MARLHRTIRRYLPRPWRAVLYACAAVALLSTLRHADLAGAARLVASVGPSILLALVPYLLAMMAQSAAYRFILGALAKSPEERPRSFTRLLSVVLSSEAVLMSVPAGTAIVEAINPYLLRRRSGVPLPMGVAVTAIKRSLVILANALYLWIAFAAGAAYLRSASRVLIGSPGLEWAVGAAGAGMLVASLLAAWALLSGSVAARSRRLLSRLPSARLSALLDRWSAGFAATDAHLSAALRARGALATATALLLAGWLLESVEAMVILRLLGVAMPFAEVLSFEVIVSLLRSLVFVVPAGLGIQDAGYVALLSALGVPDPASVAVAFVLVKRAKELFWVVVGLALFAAHGDGREIALPAPAEERA